MEETFRVRHLKYGRVIPRLRTDGRVPRERAAAETLYEIESDELTLTAQQIGESLQRGGLRPGDLVFENGGWVSLLDSVTFGRTAAQNAPRNWAALVIWLGIVLTPVAFYFVVTWLTRR